MLCKSNSGIKLDG